MEMDDFKQGSMTLSESLFDIDKINRKNTRPNSVMHNPDIGFSGEDDDKKGDMNEKRVSNKTHKTVPPK